LWLSGVVVPVEGEPALVASEMHSAIFDLDRLPVAAVFTYVDGDDPTPALRSAFAAAGLLGGMAPVPVGVEDSLWFADAELLSRAVPQSGPRRAASVFDHLRAVKDPFELEQLRLAALAHDAGYERALEVIRPGATVAEAGGEIVRAMVAAGSESLAIAGSFTTLTDRRLEPGEIVDVDLFPGSHGGYRADTARNVFIGEPAREAVRLYDATLHAFDAAVAAVRPGVTAESIHGACADAMRAAGYEQVWKVGHGVGLGDAHEPPLLQPGNTDPVREGMVFTIDPGAFYARDTPVHVEDTVVVTATGCVSLNLFPRRLQVV
jgi:Xaa-Pro aminopeptidase